MSKSTAKPPANVPPPERPLLIDACDMLHPDLETALAYIFSALVEVIFARFDKDKDGYLNLDELQAFAVAARQQSFDQHELAQIVAHYADQAKRPDLMLSEDGFIDMYYYRTQGDEDQTWRDLTRLGYGPDLQLDGSHKEAKWIVKK
ncbi:hypothetical protein BCR44DRAFT_1516096 [Catenaria anguillulae PL171]|uniref:EF-hand domain-containing protein n=1 Tax=Catenaria anguillulae PL171 TaxID=765915 RepID=A0A1Y2HAA8_9FUNG|nr:hypothetical protein BCR44DRAFT_1516096 [Catenaria anguillulae PL171]